MMGIFLKFGFTLKTGIFSITLGALIVITVIDIEHQIIPDRITLPGILFGLMAGIYLNGLRPTFIGLFLGTSLFYILAVVSRGGMGGGDIKFIAAVGALLGWQQVILIIFLSAFMGSLVGLIALAGKRLSTLSRIPFGPFLAVGTLVAYFSGEQIIHLYIMMVTGGY